MNALTALPERFAAKVRVEADGCWRWTGAVQSKGYGVFCQGGRLQLAHRFAVESTGRIIPAGMQVDHRCRNTLCVNPDHLDVVTQAENMRRRGAAVTHCVSGHLYTEASTRRNGDGHRHCRTCEQTRRAAA